jgi:hypothetical protein
VAVAIRPPVLRAAATGPVPGLCPDAEPAATEPDVDDGTDDADTTASESTAMDDGMLAPGRTDDWAITPDGTVTQRDDGVPTTTTTSPGTDVSIPTSKHTGTDDPPARPADCTCADLPGAFPCWPCVRLGRRAVPED